MLAQRLTALAVERQAGRVREHGREIGEQVAPAIEQLLLDHVLDAARRQDGEQPHHAGVDRNRLVRLEGVCGCQYRG